MVTCILGLSLNPIFLSLFNFQQVNLPCEFARSSGATNVWSLPMFVNFHGFEFQILSTSTKEFEKFDKLLWIFLKSKNFIKSKKNAYAK